MNIAHLLIAWLVTSVSFFIISKLPIGVDIDSFQKALISAGVFGILNALLGQFLNIITLGLLAIVVNAIVFGLAAYLVEGFRLRWGVWSALIGSIALSIINSILYKVLATVS